MGTITESFQPSHAPAQFNDLPDELVSLIMEHGFHIFDRRSRAVVKEILRDILETHARVPLFTQSLMETLCWIPNDFQQYLWVS